MDVMEKLARSIVVPVVVLDEVEKAVPTAQALLAGGVDTMEITFRTPCAAQCIKAVADSCPDMLVGAGTVLNVEQAKLDETLSDIVCALAQNGAGVVGVAVETKNLEEIFLSLTGGKGVA